MRLNTILKNSLSVFLIAGVLCLTAPSRAIEDQDKTVKSLASYAMGVVYDLYGETDAAIDEYKKAAEYNDNAVVHLRLGANYARMGEFSKATVELQKVLQSEPDNVQARYLLALIYSSQKEFTKAAEQYETILKSFSGAQPQNIEIYGYLGQLYYSQKDYDKAIKQFEIIASLEPTNSDVVCLLGSLYLETGNVPKATELLNRAVKLDPDNDTCLNSLGYLYAEEGVKLDEAKSFIQKALKIDPDNGAYLDSLGWVYYKQGQYTEALRYLKKADTLLTDPVIYEHIGDVYWKMNKPDNAEKYWKLSLKLKPEQKQILKKLHQLNPDQSKSSTE